MPTFFVNMLVECWGKFQTSYLPCQKHLFDKNWKKSCTVFVPTQLLNILNRHGEFCGESRRRYPKKHCGRKQCPPETPTPVTRITPVTPAAKKGIYPFIGDILSALREPSKHTHTQHTHETNGDSRFKEKEPRWDTKGSDV